MSLETELRDHLRRAAADMTVPEPDYARVVSRGRLRRGIRYLVTGAVASTMMVVVAVVVALSVGSEQTVITTPTTPITVDTTQPPTEDETGAFDTPLGRIEWRRVDGDSDSIPWPNFGLVETPTGFAAISSDWVADSRWGPIRYWRSADGSEWTPSRLPVPVEPQFARLTEAGGAFWVITVGPDTMWRSEDGESWAEVALPPGAGPWSSDYDVALHDVNGAVWLISDGMPPGAWLLEGTDWIQIDTGAMTPPDITGVRWRLTHPGVLNQPAAPLLLPGATVIPWCFSLDVDWASILGIDPTPYPYTPYPYAVWRGAQTLEIFGRGGIRPMATLDVEQRGGHFTFTDPDSGEVLHEIVVNDPSIDPQTIIEENLRVDEYSLAIVDEQGAVTQSTPPWGGFGCGATLLGGDQLVALLPGEEGGAEVWTSPDGSAWSGPAQPDFAEEDPTGQVNARVEDGTMFAEVELPGGEEVWSSTDGATWTFTGLGLDGVDLLRDAVGPGAWSLAAFESGGIYYRGMGFPRGGLAVSADLQRWELVDPAGLQMFTPDEVESSSMYTTANSIFFLTDDGTGNKKMYVWKLRS